VPPEVCFSENPKKNGQGCWDEIAIVPMPAQKGKLAAEMAPEVIAVDSEEAGGPEKEGVPKVAERAGHRSWD